MGFHESRDERDIWMRESTEHYEYIVRYVDEFVIISKNPEEITQVLENNYQLKLKVTGPISYYLGCDFYRDGNGVL